MALDAANPNAVPSQGTNLAAALEYAFGYFNPASPAGRFIIVFTDGEDHEELEGLELQNFLYKFSLYSGHAKRQLFNSENQIGNYL